MDISDSLARLTKFLVPSLRESAVRAYVHSPSEDTLQRHMVVIHARTSSALLRGGGLSRSKPEAYARALGELGECLLMYSENLESRCGIAAGLFASQAATRAKAELLERDAFLWHYRDRVPFQLVREGNELRVFRMQSADPGFHSILVTDRACAEGDSACLMFGTACNPSLEAAIEKAIQEYAAIRLNHLRNPERCEEWARDSSQVPTVMDRHHAASRDVRNRERFSALCRGDRLPTRAPLSPADWTIEKLPSPATGLKFARARHPGLRMLTFGIPEDEPGEPLLHPFW